MKKILFITSLALFVSSCNEDKKAPDFTLFKGNVEHAKMDTISLSKGDFVEKIAVKADGTFMDSIDLPEKGYYTLRVDREITQLFLTPGSSNSVSLNMEQFDESLKYSGDNAAANNYLVQKFLLSEKIDVSPREIMQNGISLDSLVMIADKNKQVYLDLLHKNNMDSSFVAMEEKAIHYKNALTLQSQSMLYQQMGKDSLMGTFVHPDVPLDNAEDFDNFESYRQLVQIDFIKATRMSEPSKDSLSFSDRGFAYIENVESDNIKKDLLHLISYEIRPGNEQAEGIYKKIMIVSTDKEFKDELTTRYEKIQKLQEGSPSPTFTYENHKGGKTTLKDLQGKYVYIDVWATWCGPCLAEIPALKKIEQDYHDKNIHFVSVSIDTENAYEKWKKMVVEKELGGIQLIADNAWKSKFVQEYAIQSIPRFILVDPEGNIVSANAPRPSDSELIGLFESEGI